MAEPDDAGFDAVAAALRKLCHDPLPELTAETYLDELPRMDSLRVLHVIATLEDQFDVSVDISALDGLRVVGDIARALCAARLAAGHR
jgi:acyl carrier protein